MASYKSPIKNKTLSLCHLKHFCFMSEKACDCLKLKLSILFNAGTSSVFCQTIETSETKTKNPPSDMKR